jgi:hypothetical protein
MKKLILMSAVLCAGTLNNMEPEKPKLEVFQELPDDVKNLIILAFAHSDNDFDTTIKNIKIASLTNKTLYLIINQQYGNLKNFTALIHWLADKFQQDNMASIAQKFGTTPVVNEYLHINNEFMEILHAIREGFIGVENNGVTVDDVKKVLDQGADPNFSDGYTSPLLELIANPMSTEELQFVQLLLDYGAKPKSDCYYDEKKAWPSDQEMKDKVKQLFQEKRKKQQ